MRDLITFCVQKYKMGHFNVYFEVVSHNFVGFNHPAFCGGVLYSVQCTTMEE
jgi:hypothetical protein